MTIDEAYAIVVKRFDTKALMGEPMEFFALDPFNQAIVIILKDWLRMKIEGEAAEAAGKEKGE